MKFKNYFPAKLLWTFLPHSHSSTVPFPFFVQKIPLRSLFKFFVSPVALDVLCVIFSRVEIGVAVEGFNLVDVMIFGFNSCGRSLWGFVAEENWGLHSPGKKHLHCKWCFILKELQNNLVVFLLWPVRRILEINFRRMLQRCRGKVVQYLILGMVRKEREDSLGYG
jgi:hypothetical protein